MSLESLARDRILQDRNGRRQKVGKTSFSGALLEPIVILETLKELTEIYNIDIRKGQTEDIS